MGLAEHRARILQKRQFVGRPVQRMIYLYLIQRGQETWRDRRILSVFRTKDGKEFAELPTDMKGRKHVLPLDDSDSIYFTCRLDLRRTE